MQRPNKPIRGKRNYQENQDKENDDTSKRRLSKNKENSGKRENDQMPKKRNTKFLQEKDDNQRESLIKILDNKPLEIKKEKMKKISENLLGYLLSFLEISDCLHIVKVDKRIRNNLKCRNTLFKLYIIWKNSNFLKTKFSSFEYCSKFKESLIDKLQYRKGNKVYYNFYKGTLKLPSGDQFEGEWKEGEPNGKGNKDFYNFYIGT